MMPGPGRRLTRELVTSDDWILSRGCKPLAHTVEDYNDLRSWGYTNRQIAERLGMKWESLRDQLRRAHRKGMKVDYYSPTAQTLRRL